MRFATRAPLPAASGSATCSAAATAMSCPAVPTCGTSECPASSAPDAAAAATAAKPAAAPAAAQPAAHCKAQPAAHGKLQEHRAMLLPVLCSAQPAHRVRAATPSLPAHCCCASLGFTCRRQALHINVRSSKGGRCYSLHQLRQGVPPHVPGSNCFRHPGGHAGQPGKRWPRLREDYTVHPWHRRWRRQAADWRHHHLGKQEAATAAKGQCAEGSRLSLVCTSRIAFPMHCPVSVTCTLPVVHNPWSSVCQLREGL